MHNYFGPSSNSGGGGELGAIRAKRSPIATKLLTDNKINTSCAKFESHLDSSNIDYSTTNHFNYSRSILRI
jgi:hypothetical protein